MIVVQNLVEAESAANFSRGLVMSNKIEKALDDVHEYINYFVHEPDGMSLQEVADSINKLATLLGIEDFLIVK